jgi:hypothetical protein
MRIVSLLGVAAYAGAMIASAHAADLATRPVTKAPPAYAPPPLTWNGFYIGAHLGGAWSEADWTTPVTGVSANSSSSGLLGGAQVGYNWQYGATVFGIEGDFSGTNLQSSNTGVSGFSNTTSAYWTSTVTGRLGYAFDRALVYGKGGLAIADQKDSVTSPGGGLFSTTGPQPRPAGRLVAAWNMRWIPTGQLKSNTITSVSARRASLPRYRAARPAPSISISRGSSAGSTTASEAGRAARAVRRGSRESGHRDGLPAGVGGRTRMSVIASAANFRRRNKLTRSGHIESVASSHDGFARAVGPFSHFSAQWSL